LRQPFHSNEAMSRVRAIAADRTRASLTGGCSGGGIFRIYTEFLQRGRRAGPAGQPGLATSASERPQGSHGSGKPRQGAWGGGWIGRYAAGRRLYSPRRKRAIERAFAGRAVRSRSRAKDAETRIGCFFGSVELAKAQRQNRVVAHLRFGRRGVHATVREVLTRAIAASEH
jgi:hypothetical protein